jgi:hypothetical protein
MNPDQQHPHTTTVAERRKALALLIALCSIPPLLAPSTVAIACSDRVAGAAACGDRLVCSRQDVLSLEKVRNISPQAETRRFKIRSINAPDGDGELGTIVFGSGESLVQPSALRGPR